MARPKFTIDISRYEYTEGKDQDLSGYRIFVYSPEMMVAEKLRAICQQMSEYGPVVKRNRAGGARARQFLDIHTLIVERRLEMTSQKNRELLGHISRRSECRWRSLTSFRITESFIEQTCPP